MLSILGLEAELEQAFIVPQRSIGGIVATVTVREDHRDEVIITEHPVEQGAAISDHAFKRPAEVIIEVGWPGDPFVTGEQGFYGQLLQLQALRDKFTVYTAKRTYQNMLIASLRTFTDERTANALMAHVICREVITVSTQVVTVPNDAQSTPTATAGTKDVGPQLLAPAPNFNPTGLGFTEGGAL